MKPSTDFEIFCAALELRSSEEQRAWVEKSCKDDPAKLERVQRLLASHLELELEEQTKSKSILNKAEVVYKAFSAAHFFQRGDLLGDYRIDEKIGEGGMGVVYSAHKESSPDEQVAIKVLKPGLDFGRLLERFTREYHLLGRLKHPGITRLIDIGVKQTGQPFFVMEIVHDAISVTTFCNQQGLDLRQRIKLFLEVCDIVQYAHGKGVIHRDIKPCNILLSGRDSALASPKLIDFGIAKILRGDESSFPTITLTGERFGTPAYMSPEQRDGTADSIDIRADIYSLGAILHELLVGDPPQTLSSRQEKLSGHAALPSKQLESRINQSSHDRDSSSIFAANWQPRDLTRELDWIVVKAIALSPNDRYQTVSDFAKDLRDYLAGNEVTAVRPSFSYRIEKLFTRHRYKMTASLAIACIFIVASFVSTYFAYVASNALQQSEQRLEEAREAKEKLTIERDHSDASRKSALRIIKAFRVQRVLKFSMVYVHSKYFRDLVSSDLSPEEKSRAFDDFRRQNLILTMCTPHPRLKIVGDWSWTRPEDTASQMDDIAMFTSSEIAKELQSARSAPAEPPAPGDQPPLISSEAPTLESLSDGFLKQFIKELKAEFGEHDLFVAEMLDNAGLHAIDRNVFKEAASCFADAIRNWDQRSDCLANSIQSRLFLAESLINTGDLKMAEQTLKQAEQLLTSKTIPEDSQLALRDLFKMQSICLSQRAQTN